MWQTSSPILGQSSNTKYITFGPLRPDVNHCLRRAISGAGDETAINDKRLTCHHTGGVGCQEQCGAD